jgi:hypothetical protein
VGSRAGGRFQRIEPTGIAKGAIHNRVRSRCRMDEREVVAAAARDSGTTTSPRRVYVHTLDPVTDDALDDAARDLVTQLTRLGPNVRATRCLIAAGDTVDKGA